MNGPTIELGEDDCALRIVCSICTDRHGAVREVEIGVEATSAQPLIN